MKFLAALIPALISALTSLLGRIIAAIGLTVVTYIGFAEVIAQLKAKIHGSVTGVSAGLLQMFYLAGGGTILNICFGCLTFAVTFKTLSKLIPKGKKA